MSYTGKPTTFSKKVFGQRPVGVNRGMIRVIVIPIAFSGKSKNGIKNGYLSSLLVIEKQLCKIIGTSNFRLKIKKIGSR